MHSPEEERLLSFHVGQVWESPRGKRPSGLSEFFSVPISQGESARQRLIKAAARCEAYLRISDQSDDFDVQCRYARGAAAESRRAFAIARANASAFRRTVAPSHANPDCGAHDNIPSETSNG